MENIIELIKQEDADSWETLMFLYNAALKEINTKIDILNDEFQHIYHYTPIEHIKSRIKTPASIVNKLKKNGYETSVENMVRHVNDIAGIRIICSFTSDIYLIADMITKQSDLKVVSVKDYITHPKVSGYQSYHILVTVPIHLTQGIVDTIVEIQIRTIAQDFWASLEHKLKYKKNIENAEEISRELSKCAEASSMLDLRMQALRDRIEASRE